ncbi:hypothetical protein Hanom_Chr05g00394311 [Helianthus anomalus]
MRKSKGTYNHKSCIDCFASEDYVELGLIFGHTWYELVIVSGVNWSSSSLKHNYYIPVRFKALHLQTNYALQVCFNALHLHINYALTLASFADQYENFV